MTEDKEYFIKSVVSLLFLGAVVFLYLSLNTKSSELNRELSVNTGKYIELKSEISKLEIKYNRLISNTELEKKAKKFKMHLPEASDIIRVKGNNR